MADELVLRRWCDVCPPHTTPAVQRWTLHIAAQHSARPTGTRVLDTCDDHGQVPRDALALAREHGRPERAAATTTRPARGTPPPPADVEQITCPRCDAAVLRTSIGSHAMTQHGVRVRQPVKCPDCREKFIGPNAMVTHRRRKHDYDSVAALLLALTP